jgi:glucokinase
LPFPHASDISKFFIAWIMMNKTLKQAIGIDLGGTKIDIARVSSSGMILESRRLDTDVKGGPKVIEERILKVIDDMSHAAGGSIQGIGIGVAGQIDDEDGTVLFGPNLHWHEHPLQQNIHNATQLPVKVINDVRAIAWAEWLYGAAQGCDDFVCLIVGTGIGGAIVKNGQMQKGCNNSCGEVGHMTIDFHGPLCTCGNQGCLEAFAGGWALAKQARESIQSGHKSFTQTLLQLAQNDIEKVTAKTVVEAYHKKDPLATQLIEQFKQALTAGCVSLVNALNPCRLILGGGLLSGLPDFIPLIESSIRQKALKSATKKLEVLSSKFNKDEAGSLGAAALIFNEQPQPSSR